MIGNPIVQNIGYIGTTENRHTAVEKKLNTNR